MSDAETIAALAFLLSLGLGLGLAARGRWEFDTVRGLLAANVVVSAVIFAIANGWSARGAVFVAIVGLGGSEAGCWAALGLNRVLPVPDPEARQGKAFQDPWRDGVLLGSVLLIFLAMGLQSRREDQDAAALDTVEMPSDHLPVL